MHNIIFLDIVAYCTLWHQGNITEKVYYLSVFQNLSYASLTGQHVVGIHHYSTLTCQNK
jgi:hypothetical protein